VLAIARQSGHDRLCGAGRLQMTGRRAYSFDRRRVGQIDITTAQRDAGRAATAKWLLHFEAAVTVGVAQRHGAAAGLRLTTPATRHERHIQVAIRRHCHVTRRAEAVGHDERTEAGRKLEAAIVGIAHRLGVAMDEYQSKDADRRRLTSDAEPFVQQHHHESPVVPDYCSIARKPGASPTSRSV
jgi:hypothetical protein